MATDIAFVLGVVALLGDRCPPGVRVFLLTLAIVDDIGAVTVIAVFYSTGVDLVALAGAGAVLGLIALALRLTTWRGPAYMVAGLVLWALVLAAGMHPTIAGVALGLITAVHPPRRDAIARAASLGRVFRRDLSAAGGRATALEVSRAVSPNERFQGAIHPWSSYAIVPLFALANAGVPLGADSLSRALTSPITLGVIVGLVVGKALGISLVSLAGLRAGVGVLPRGVGRGHLGAAAALAGIGFTVSLFVAELAFEDEALREEAKIGVLVASALAAAVGWALFRLVDARRGRSRRSPASRRLEPRRGPPHRPPSRRGRRRDHAGAVRRLLVSAHPRRGGRAGGGCGATRRSPRRRLPPSADRGRPPGCAGGRRGGGGRGRPGPVLGDARPADGRPRHPAGARAGRPRRGAGPGPGAVRERPPLPRTRAGGGGRRGQRPAQRCSRDAGLLPRRPAAGSGRLGRGAAAPAARTAGRNACKTQEFGQAHRPRTSVLRRSSRLLRSEV